MRNFPSGPSWLKAPKGVPSIKKDHQSDPDRSPRSIAVSIARRPFQVRILAPVASDSYEITEIVVESVTSYNLGYDLAGESYGD